MATQRVPMQALAAVAPPRMPTQTLTARATQRMPTRLLTAIATQCTPRQALAAITTQRTPRQTTQTKKGHHPAAYGRGQRAPTQAASGEITKINIQTGEKTVVATVRPGIDNLAIADDNRLFISHFVDGGVAEIEANGHERVPGNVAVRVEAKVLGVVLPHVAHQLVDFR